VHVYIDIKYIITMVSAKGILEDNWSDKSARRIV